MGKKVTFNKNPIMWLGQSSHSCNSISSTSHTGVQVSLLSSSLQQPTSALRQQEMPQDNWTPVTHVGTVDYIHTLYCWESSRQWLKSLSPCTHMVDLERVSWLWIKSVPSQSSQSSAVNQPMEDLFHCLSFSLWLYLSNKRKINHWKNMTCFAL